MAYDLHSMCERLNIKVENIILVGAWEGAEIKGFLDAGDLGAYLFEAEPRAIEMLKQSYGTDLRVKIFEGAVSSQSGLTLKFNVMNHSSSSLYIPNMEELRKILPDFQVEKEIYVKTITLDSTLEPYFKSWSSANLGNLMILDIQGGELEALRGAPELLKKIGWIHSEVSTIELYQGQNSLKELDCFLRENGFLRLSKRLYPKLHHGDALYFKTGLIPSFFKSGLLLEDIHWMLAQRKPSWIPPLKTSFLGRLILKLVFSQNHR